MVRLSSFVRRCASNCCSSLLTVAFGVPKLAAACVKLPLSTMRTNARKAATWSIIPSTPVIVHNDGQCNSKRSITLHRSQYHYVLRCKQD